MKNAINWFEIPTTDIDRAAIFYEKIFGFKLQVLNLPNIKMRIFPVEDQANEVSGALVNSGFHKPSQALGPLLYLNANPDVNLVLNKVVKAGGKIIVPKTVISDDMGAMAVILDCEGNRIALMNGPNKE